MLLPWISGQKAQDWPILHRPNRSAAFRIHAQDPELVHTGTLRISSTYPRSVQAAHARGGTPPCPKGMRFVVGCDQDDLAIA